MERYKPKVLLNSSRENYLKNKKEAKKIILERLEHFNKFYGFNYKKIFIRNTKSRWGSCSRAGNLNFNFKLIFLSPEQRDYIIVHELCHLKEFNHSKKFWDLVKQTIPHYKILRKELRGIQ